MRLANASTNESGAGASPHRTVSAKTPPRLRATSAFFCAKSQAHGPLTTTPSFTLYKVTKRNSSLPTAQPRPFTSREQQVKPCALRGPRPLLGCRFVMVSSSKHHCGSSLWNQREHLAQIRSPEIGGCSEQQTIVELHHAAIRVLVAVPQVIKNRFGPSAA